MIVMDIGLPGMNGIGTTQVNVRNDPGTKVVMLSICADEYSVVSAIRAGAQAYVLKKASGSDLLEAMRAVAKGGSCLSPEVSDHLLRGIGRTGPAPTPLTSALEVVLHFRRPGGQHETIVKWPGDRRSSSGGKQNRRSFSMRFAGIFDILCRCWMLRNCWKNAGWKLVIRRSGDGYSVTDPS
jgi:CheY-like chemotaxis protein